MLLLEEEQPIFVDTLLPHENVLTRDGTEQAKYPVESMLYENCNDNHVDIAWILNAVEVDVDDNIDAHAHSLQLIQTLASSNKK